MQMNEDRDAALAASDPAALVDEYSTLFMAGQMSPFMRDVLITRLNQMSDGQLRRASSGARACSTRCT